MPRDPRDPRDPKTTSRPQDPSRPTGPGGNGVSCEAGCGADCGCGGDSPRPKPAGSGAAARGDGNGDPSSIEEGCGANAPNDRGCHELVRRRSFDFTNLATSSSIDLVLERAVPTAAFADAVLQVRVHALTIPAGASLTWIVSATSPCPDEPGTDFVDANPVGQATIDSTVVAPAMRLAQLGAGFGRAVRVILRGTRGGTGGSFTATLSACLVLKEHPSEPAQLRVLTTHAYDDSSTSAKQFIPFAGTVAGGTLSSATNELAMLAAYDGWLRRVTVRATGSIGNTIVALHRNYSGTASATRSLSVSANVSTVFEFGADASFLAGEPLSIGIDPTNTPNSVTVVCEWVYRRG